SSPSLSTGQATIAANVAIAAAKSGTATILVDADLRTPSLEQRFGLEKGIGLADLLSEESITMQHVLLHVRNTFIPDLRLLSAGTAVEGAALLLSTKLQTAIQAICLLLSESETGSGLVIFNSAPVLKGPDASLIGTLVEQTILTIAKGRTTRTQARQAQEQLVRAHTNLVGIVMLDV